MTDPRGVHSAHLDAATIAALVDRTLDPAARAAAEAHLAGCADCREVWMDTSDIASDTEVGGWAATPTTADAPGPRGRSRRWIYGGAGLAIAAALALVVFSPRLFNRGDRPELRELVEAVGTNRTTEGRLTGGFKWGPVPQTLRSRPLPVPAAIRAAIGELRHDLGTEDAEAIAAAASASLILGDHDQARALMSRALATEPNNPEFWTDLSAIELEAARLGNPMSARTALEAADKALEIRPGMPEALFNRALALTRLQRNQDAIRAWESYLATDLDPAWTAEARARMRTTHQ